MYLKETTPGARIILAAPSPINEHQLWVADQERGLESISRKAEVVKSYADAVCEIGKEISVPVLNLWEDFMSTVGFDTSANGPIPGSSRLPPDDKLAKLVHDGR